jgi:hypothetical protein
MNKNKSSEKTIKKKGKNNNVRNYYNPYEQVSTQVFFNCVDNIREELKKQFSVKLLIKHNVDSVLVEKKYK